MTKQTLQENINRECDLLDSASTGLYSAEAWKKCRPNMILFIKNMDELTEIYENENKGKL
jgi:hypothetical protein